MRIGLLASHNGTNAQAIIDACNSGELPAKPVMLISNNSQSGAARRAEREGIAFRHLSGKTHPSPTDLDRAIRDALVEHDVKLVVLVGYMKRLGPLTLERFAGRIINTHPALLPKFGGQGMYGGHVHEAVIAAGEKETGITIHVVSDEYDRGPIIAQWRMPVAPDDTPESLAEKLLPNEHRFMVETLGKIVSGEITLPADGPT